MGDTKTQLAWVSEYDYPNRTVSLTLASPDAHGEHWSGIRRSDLLSDPDGQFDVFTGFRIGSHDSDEVGPIVKIVAELDDEGGLANPHPDFNDAAIGSPTIWPYKIAGERFGLDHWVWWSNEEVFLDSPRAWVDAVGETTS